MSNDIFQFYSTDVFIKILQEKCGISTGRKEDMTHFNSNMQCQLNTSQQGIAAAPNS